MTTELRKSGLIRLHTRRRGASGWIIPAWATLCGAVASGALEPTLPALVRLLLALLLVEVGWGTTWGALATTNWITPLRRWRHWHVGAPSRFLPYTQPGSPGYRLARSAFQLRSWYQAVMAPSTGPAIGAVAAGVALSLVLAAVGGTELVLLTLAGCAFMELAVVLDRGRGQAPGGWDALIRLGLPWLAGHATFAPLSTSSLILAATFSLAVGGLASARGKWGRVLWAAGQLLTAILFVSLRQPLIVALLTLLLFPQWLATVQSAEVGTATTQRWTRRAWPWLAAAMLLAAWSL